MRGGPGKSSPWMVACLSLAVASAALTQESPESRRPRATAPQLDIQALLSEAERSMVRDLAAWRDFAFRRRVLRRKLDRSGEITWTAVYDFAVRPEGEAFVEDLLDIDGRPPTRAEKRQHRHAARFQKHYHEAGALTNPFGPDIPLEQLLFDHEYIHQGLETVRGERCHRLRRVVRSVPPDLPLERELGYAMSGSLCLSVAGSHLVEAELAMVRPVEAGPVTMRALEIGIDAEPIEAGIFLPRRFEMRTDMLLGPKHVGRWNRYEYGEFVRLEPVAQ